MKAKFKIDNPPVIPSLSFTDTSKEISNPDSFQKLRKSLDEKEKKERRRATNKEIRYWILTSLLMALSFLVGKFL